MYPFERFMSHLKRKVKNMAKVEGSIVKQYLVEEDSYFSEYYFESHIETKNRKANRYDDGEAPYYPVTGLPDIFTQIGRVGRKSKEIWLNKEDHHIAHTYVLMSCEYLQKYESIYEEYLRRRFSGISDVDLVKNGDGSTSMSETFPLWLRELIKGPIMRVFSWPMYVTRGYVFHTHEYGSEKSSTNYGICVKGYGSDLTEDPGYYGILDEIIQLEYPGLIGLKIILFRCNWFDTTIGRGVRKNSIGVIDVNTSQSYKKYEPFILASQTDQVVFIPYPKINITNSRDSWYSAIKINPRGRLEGGMYIPLQEDETEITFTVQELQVNELVTPFQAVEQMEYEEIGDEEPFNEFEENNSEEYETSSNDINEMDCSDDE